MMCRRWVIMLFLPAVMSGAGCAVYPIRAEVDFQATADFAGVKRVAVETRNGSIEVRCVADRSDVDVRAVRYAHGITIDDARTWAEEIQIETRRDPEDPDLLRIAAQFPVTQPGRNMGASFRIALPPQAAFRLRSSNGRITLTGAAGDVDADTSNGAMNLSEIRGSVKARTRNGRITTRAVTGDVDLCTSNGAIHIEDAGHRLVRAETANSRIRALRIKGDVSLRSSNGSIELRAVSVSDAPQIKAVTSNGRVTVEVPAPVNAELRMQTSNGRVSADLKGATVTELESGRSRMRATLNDGAGLIELRSSNGSLTFQTAAAEP